MRARHFWTTMTVLAVTAMLTGVGSAQGPKHNPRFGKWKLKQDGPAINVMTYEAYGKGGMRVTIDATSKDGKKTHWGYITMFDGKDEPVTGDSGSDTAAVRIIDAKVNEIVYKKGGKVTQVLNNVLTDDGQRLEIDYKRTSADGRVSVTHATYERMK